MSPYVLSLQYFSVSHPGLLGKKVGKSSTEACPLHQSRTSSRPATLTLILISVCHQTTNQAARQPQAVRPHKKHNQQNEIGERQLLVRKGAHKTGGEQHLSSRGQEKGVLSRGQVMSDISACDHTSAGAPPDFAIKQVSYYNLASHVDVSTTSHKHEHLGPLTALFLTQICILVCLKSPKFGWYVDKRSISWAGRR